MCPVLVATLLLEYVIVGSWIGTGCGVNTEDINFLVLLSFEVNESFLEQSSYTDGPELLPAIELAVDQINQQQDLLSGYSVNITVANAPCNLENYALVKFVEAFFHSGTRFAGIVGPTCSDETEVLSAFTGKDVVSTLNFHIASSQRLTDRSQYGYSFGTVGSTHSEIELFIQLMKRNEWYSVAVLYEESRIVFLSAYSLFVKELDRVFPQGRISLSVPISKVDMPLSLITDHHVRVIFVLSAFDLAAQILCLISRDYPQLTYPTYQFVFMEVNSVDASSFIYNKRHYECSVREITQIMEGFFISHTQLSQADNQTELVSGVTYGNYSKLYGERVNGIPTVWANPTYDAVWSLALALNNSIPKLSDINISLSEYSYGMQQATDIIRDEVVKLSFQGASGYISFNNETGYSNLAVDLHQRVDNDIVLVATYSEHEGSLMFLEDGEFVENSFESVEVLVHPALASLCLLLGAVAFILIVIAHIVTLTYHNFPAIRASSYRIGQLAFTGCYFIVVCFICFTAQKVASMSTIDITLLCEIQIWCIPLGLTLILGTVTAKTWRLYCIFVHLKEPGMLLTDKLLVFAVLLLAVVDIVLCAIWTSQFPFSVLHHETITDDNMIEVQVECNSDHYHLWFGVLTLYQGLIMFFALILALLTKSIRHKSFKTKSVTLLVYTLTITLYLGLPMYFVLNDGKGFTSVNASYAVLSLTYIAVLYLCFTLLFFPPILSLLRVKLFHKVPGLRSFSTINTISSTYIK